MIEIVASPTLYRVRHERPIAFQIEACWLGKVLVATTHVGICSIELGDSDEEVLAQLKERFPNAMFYEIKSTQSTWVKQAIQYVESAKSATDLPLDIQGVAFQKKVWNALRDSPKGETMTYTKIT